MRKIFMGADSAGFELKEHIKEKLTAEGYTVFDMGAFDSKSSHYPEYASAVCEKVLEDTENSYGILICGTGIGMSMCANKYNGIRAALCSDTFSARMTRVHNNANVLCMGARVIGSCLAEDIVDSFLAAEFEAGGRHEMRVNMITDIEKKQK
ncbi:MAG: ribose 5-phosphate isomerase B [Clostridia bacterium]|nr:ribose 5-phosphate isomerase B [Clostridia bacterium]